MRMRLARLIAGQPIMVDPWSGVDGVFVLVREGVVSLGLKADKFRLKTSSNIVKSSARFVGTVDL